VVKELTVALHTSLSEIGSSLSPGSSPSYPSLQPSLIMASPKAIRSLRPASEREVISLVIECAAVRLLHTSLSEIGSQNEPIEERD